MPISTLAIAHVNLNCRDLAKNKTFFEALGLAPTIHTDPAPQDCKAFGFEGDARWDAWMMQDSRGGAGTALDLLEWKDPTPIGSPPFPGSRPGLERLGLTASDIEAARKAVLDHGGWASPVQELVLGPGAARTGFGASTPEGQALLILAADGDRLAHVGLGCSNLDRSEAFYASVFGMNRVADLNPDPFPAEVFQPGPSASTESSEWRARILYPPNPKAEPGQPNPFHVLLTEWEHPKPTGRGLAEPNRLGIFRMAFLVEDIDSCHAELGALGVSELSPVISLNLGPSCPAPTCRALFFRDPDGTCLELIGAPQV